MWYVQKNKEIRSAGVVAAAAATAVSAPTPTPALAAGAAPVALLTYLWFYSSLCLSLLVCADCGYLVTPIGPPFTKPSFTLVWADPRCLATLVSCTHSCLLGFVFVCADPR